MPWGHRPGPGTGRAVGVAGSPQQQFPGPLTGASGWPLCRCVRCGAHRVGPGASGPLGSRIQFSEVPDGADPAWPASLSWAPGSGHKTGVGQPRVSGGGPAGSVPLCPSPEWPEGMREEKAGARRLPHPCLVQLLLKHTCCSLHLPGSLSVSLPTPPSLSPPLSPHPSLPGTRASLPSVRPSAGWLSPLECRSPMAAIFCCLHRSPQQLGLCGGPRAVPSKCLWGEGTGCPQCWPASGGRTPPVLPTLLTSCPVCH